MPCAGCARRKAKMIAAAHWVRAKVFPVSELTHPVLRRRASDPLLHLFARQADGWTTHAIAFKTIAEVEQSGWTVGAWQTDEHGEFAPLTRP